LTCVYCWKLTLLSGLLVRNVLRFSREEYQAALQAGEADEDGVEAAFEVVTDVNERYVDLNPAF
jgi:hypothetical protein